LNSLLIELIGKEERLHTLTNSNYEKEIGLLIYSRTERIMLGTQGILWRFLTLPYPMVSVNGRLQKSYEYRTTE